MTRLEKLMHDSGYYAESTFDTRAEADGAVYVPETNDACADCGSTGHNSGSNTCPGPNEQDRLEAM